jgi:Divergent InlB B-repeat domain
MARMGRFLSFFKPLTVLVCLLFIAGCSGGGGDGGSSSPDDPIDTQTLGGNATKGPLANADVEVFALDASAGDLRGTAIASGVTNAQARIAVDLPVNTSGLLVVAVTANANTTDLTTGQSPVLTRLSTIAVASEWLNGQPVYATPLSHMAVEIAASNIGGSPDVSVAQIRSALARAQRVVRSTVGFGLLDDATDPEGPINLFSTAPILTNAAVDAGTRQRTLRYRKATEAIAAVLADISGSTETEAIETLFDSLTDDLADGRVDDSTLASDLSAAQPEALPIPNAIDNQTVGDTLNIVNSEKTAVGVDNTEVADLVEADDEFSQSANTDSGLTSADLVGEVAQLTLEATPGAAGTLTLTGGEATQPLVFEVGVDDEVTVTASPAEGFAFARWAEGGAAQSQQTSYTFTVDASSTLVAEFSAGVVVQADPQTGGAPSAGQAFFEPGATVTLTASPATGFEFFAWVDAEGMRPEVFAEGANEVTPASFTMPPTPLSLIAVYQFSAITDPDPAQGEISRRFDEDGNVLLTAIPQAGFVFVQWTDQTGTVLSTQREDFQIDLAAIDGDSQIVAEFAEAPLESAIWGQFNWGEAVWQ